MAKYFKKLSNAAFSAFCNNLKNAVTTNATAWGIPAAVVAELTGKNTTYQSFYTAIENKRERTATQVAAHERERTVMEDYVEGFANQYLIGNAAITDEALESVGFNRKADPGTRPVIEEVVFGKFESKAGHRVLVICRTDSDSSRASILSTADGVELRYKVGSPMTNENDFSNSITSTKARFELNLSPEDEGKKIYGFLRWVNASNPEKNGPFSRVAEAVVS